MRPLGPPDGRPEVLALRALKLGDLLVAVPALRGLRRAHPAHRLVLACPGWLAPVAEAIGGIDALLPTPGLDAPLPLAPGRVAVAANLHGSGPESRALVDRLGAPLTIAHRVPEIDGDRPRDPRMPRWRDDLPQREVWVRLVGAFGVPADPLDLGLRVPSVATPADGATVLHVGAFHGARRWPADRFAAVARALRAEGHRVVYTGSAAERLRAREVAALAGDPPAAVLAGELDLAAFLAAVARARLVVTADTGAGHLASAYGRPSVVLFGPASPAQWGPPPGPHAVLTDEGARRGDVFAETPDPAILAVGVDDVLRAAEAVLRPPADPASASASS